VFKESMPYLIGLLQTLATLGSIGAAGYFGYKTALTYWVEAKPNEWMLVIRNGKLVKRDIGLCTWLMPGD
jgi:predicted acetyltransferase